MSYVPFVPLRIFSAYTMLDGAMEPKAIGKYAKNLGFPAIAISDRNGLYGVMAFEDGCRATGVQPILGTLISVAREKQQAGTALQYDWLALYAQNETGYENLCKLVSASHLDRPISDDAHVSLSDICDHNEGLIALTAGGEGALTRLIAEGQIDDAHGYLDTLQNAFGDRLYIELCRRGDKNEETAENALIELAYERNIALVATNPSCFAEPDFFEAHDAMLCIAQGAYIESEDRKHSSREAWIKSGPQMREIFADIPEALSNTLIIAQRCGVGSPRRAPILPSIAGDIDAEAQQLRDDARKGLDDRLSKYGELGDAQRQVYYDRLDFETKVITDMGFPGYFLIVADFIKWAKDNGIAVGPGRGSGAGSVVAWSLTITDLDPIELGLLFERFLNPDRVSMPDFDIDFCETRRTEVIQYVQQKYGRDQVAQIITFGKLKARAVLRDTGRVLQMSYGQVDRLCKMVPNHPTDPWDLKRALGGVAELREEYRREDDVRRLFDLAMKLEGLPRHSSTHAAGVVIGDRNLSHLVPLYRDPRSEIPVTQFDMKFVEIAGLVKFDFLGLKTLSVLQRAEELLALRDIKVDLPSLPVDDPKVYELLQSGNTVGVFQLESEGMRRTLSAVKPTNFGDIIALVSLYRPGPMDNIPMFGRRKNGEEEISYPHDLLETVLKETYGIFVYQEQVMQAAQILAGYTLGGADLLRRAMGKKIQAEMDTQREIFVKGCKEHNDIDAAKANELFDLIDKFAGYGFNKSHAAAYALLAYHTAWFKAYYPHEFYAASMRFDMHQTDKLGIFIDDMRRLEVKCLAPCVNKSEANFTVAKDDNGELAVLFALAGVKNVGEKAMESLVAERNTSGAYKSIDDFANRIDPTMINRRQLENLASGGAFDSIEANRAAVFEAADTIISAAQSAKESRESGQGGLFGEGSSDVASLRLNKEASWALGERMMKEKDAYGFYFSAHPVTQFEAVARSNGARSYSELMLSGPIAEGTRKPAVIAALIEGVRWRESRRGKRFVLVDLSDSSGQFSASCFEEEVASELAEHAKTAECVLLNIEMDMKEGDETPRFSIKSARPLAKMVQNARIQMALNVTKGDAFHLLANLMAPYSNGRGRLVANVECNDNQIPVILGQNFRLDGDIAAQVAEIDGIDNVVIAPLRADL